MSELDDLKLSQEQLAKYEQVLGLFKKILSDSDLYKLEYLAYQLTDIIEHNRILLPNGKIGEFVLEVVAKAVNEAWALTGSLFFGAYTSCFHHARAVIEVYASLVYVFSKPEKKRKRIKKYYNYHLVYFYKHYKLLHDLFKQDKITEEVFRHQCLVSDDKFKELEKKVPMLAKLYGVKDDELCKVKNWHHPALISNLLETAYNRVLKKSAQAEDGAVTKGADLDNLSKIYAEFCEMTHLSPLSGRAVGSSLMFGYPQVKAGQIKYDDLNRPISITQIMLTDIILLLEEELKIKIDINLPKI